MKVLDKEWNGVWMLKKVEKRRGMEHFQYQTLRYVLKVEGDRMKEFVAKYREVKVKTSRQKVINIQLNQRSHNTMFKGTESLSRRKSWTQYI